MLELGRCYIRRVSIMSVLSAGLLACPMLPLTAQFTMGARREVLQGWAFGRIGPADAAKADLRGQVSASIAAGLAASYGPMVGMFRATGVDAGRISDNAGTGITDYAVLGGVRSRGQRLFVVGAAGIAESSLNGTLNTKQLAPSFDLSAHADYRIVGVGLSLAGVLGPSSTRYVALSFGAELGWFGSR
jgi:hypothetical protein